jgi:Xaa-Pro dipeptidase
VLQLDRLELLDRRVERLRRAAEALEIDTWVLTRSRSVRFATGTRSANIDLLGEQTMPIVTVGPTVIDAAPPLVTPGFVGMLLDELPPSGRVAIDRLSGDALRRLRAARPQLELVDAATLLAHARNPLDPLEIDVMADALARTEAAFLDVIANPEGLTERQLAARFQTSAVDHGIELQTETVFSVLPTSIEEAPWRRGDWANDSPYRGRTTDRVVQSGDIVTFDGGGDLDGYASDLGLCFLAGGASPTSAQRELSDRWNEVALRVIEAARPGASSRDLAEAARNGWPGDQPNPWPRALYVAHGIGTDVAQSPFAGADDGTAAIDVGHVLMIEPYIFVEGVGGYRAEYCVAVEPNQTRILNTQPVGAWALPA